MPDISSVACCRFFVAVLHRRIKGKRQELIRRYPKAISCSQLKSVLSPGEFRTKGVLQDLCIQSSIPYAGAEALYSVVLHCETLPGFWYWQVGPLWKAPGHPLETRAQMSKVAKAHACVALHILNTVPPFFRGLLLACIQIKSKGNTLQAHVQYIRNRCLYPPPEQCVRYAGTLVKVMTWRRVGGVTWPLVGGTPREVLLQ